MKALDPLAVPLGDTTLIEASAGTGKTWTLATLYLRLLVEARLEVGQILVVTYTNAATAELRDRIRSRVREAVTVFEQAAAGTPPDAEPLASLVRRCRDAGTLDATVKHLRNALRGFDEAAIFTIHGFCQRILLENAFESGVAFDAELVTDERPLCTEVVQDFWVEHLHAAPPAFVAYMQKNHQAKDMEVLARRVLSSRDMSILPKPKDTDTFDPTGLQELARTRPAGPRGSPAVAGLRRRRAGAARIRPAEREPLSAGEDSRLVRGVRSSPGRRCSRAAAELRPSGPLQRQAPEGVDEWHRNHAAASVLRLL